MRAPTTIVGRSGGVVRTLVQVDATNAGLKACVARFAGAREGAAVVRAGRVRPTVGEAGCRESRIRALVDVDALAELLARGLDALVPCLAVHVPLAAPFSVATWTVIVAPSTTTRVP